MASPTFQDALELVAEQADARLADAGRGDSYADGAAAAVNCVFNLLAALRDHGPDGAVNA